MKLIMMFNFILKCGSGLPVLVAPEARSTATRSSWERYELCVSEILASDTRSSNRFGASRRRQQWQRSDSKDEFQGGVLSDVGRRLAPLVLWPHTVGW